MPAKFECNEVVRVVGDNPRHKKIQGREGTVLGMSESETNKGLWGYAVSFDDVTWDIMEEFLESTGKKMRREDFYTGESIRVRVTEDGCGEVIPDDERDYDA